MFGFTRTPPAPPWVDVLTHACTAYANGAVISHGAARLIAEHYTPIHLANGAARTFLLTGASVAASQVESLYRVFYPKRGPLLLDRALLTAQGFRRYLFVRAAGGAGGTHAVPDWSTLPLNP